MFDAIPNSAGTFNFQIQDLNSQITTQTFSFFIGASDGSNWEGRESGTLTLDFTDTSNYTTSVTGYTGFNATNLSIPTYIFNSGSFWNIESIGESAFQDCAGLKGDLKFLSLTENIIDIGDSSFEGCSNSNGTLFLDWDRLQNNYMGGTDAFKGCNFCRLLISKVYDTNLYNSSHTDFGFSSFPSNGTVSQTRALLDTNYLLDILKETFDLPSSWTAVNI